MFYGIGRIAGGDKRIITKRICRKCVSIFTTNWTIRLSPPATHFSTMTFLQITKLVFRFSVDIFLTQSGGGRGFNNFFLFHTF